MTTFQLHIDLREGIAKAVPELHQPVVLSNSVKGQERDNAQKNKAGYPQSSHKRSNY